MMPNTDNLDINKYIDLHTHTIHSDGALTPEELVKKAKEVGLVAIAVTDHENTEGLDAAIRVGKEVGVEVIPAVEITSHPNSDTEHHILGYFIDYKDKKFQEELTKIQESREERTKKVIKNLNGLGFFINFEDVKAATSGTIVAPHIAFSVISNVENHKKLEKEFGTMPETGDFIRKYLIPGTSAYEPREALTPKESIDLIHSVGGLAVLAHPCWTAAKKEGQEIVFDDNKVAEVQRDGIDGVEALAHRENQEDTEECVNHFSALAKKYNLVVTGGSDFHGFGSAGKALGFTDFYLKVPYSVLENLKKINAK